MPEKIWKSQVLFVSLYYMNEAKPAPQREYYKVLIISQPGKGKTFSFRLMDPKKFGMVNIENKPLPFKNNFIYHDRPVDRVEVNNSIVKFAKNPEIEAIGIDSFSAYSDILIAEARANYKGFEIYNFYNEQLAKFFNLIKKIQKEVYITSHYEIIGMEGNQEKRAKVTGKQFEGIIEKEFTIVLLGDNKFQENGKPEYFFKLVEENTSAKCPPDIFGPDVHKIDNDLNFVQAKIKQFAG